jgi:hypothetical protein
MTDGSGRTLPDSLAHYDRATRCWKTSQGCLPLTEDESLERSSPTWPTAGTMRNGTIYPLPPLVPRTSGTGSSLLPAFPTPSATEPGFNPATRHPVDKHGNPPTHPNQRWYDPKTGRLMQKGLPQVAKMWPTPMAADATQERTPEAHYRRQAEKKAANPNLGGLHKPLITAVLERQMWPTPRTSERAAGMTVEHAGYHANLEEAVALAVTQAQADSSTPPSAASGSLNPTWVEWLMGFPTGWTV